MNKKIYIIILLVFILLLFYYINSKDNSEHVYINELYQNNTEQTENISTDIIVHITGSVCNPGIVTAPSGSRIIDIISYAGGATSDADFSKVNLAYIVSDAQKIYIPSVNDVDNMEYIDDSPGNNVIKQENNSNAVNINTASQSELENLPGVGPSTAAKIINFRNENGNFKKIEDIMNVSGIGEAKFNSLKDYICTK